MTFREAHGLTETYWQRQQREVLPMAMLIQILCNVHRDSDQRREPFSLDDVLSWLGYAALDPAPPPARPRTPAELEAQVELLHAMYSQIAQANGQVQD